MTPSVAGFEHYMLKEIFEQPTAIHNSSWEPGRPRGGQSHDRLGAGVGQAWSPVAVLTTRRWSESYIIEALAKIPTTVELASEYRYSPGTGESPLTVLLTQRGNEGTPWRPLARPAGGDARPSP
jgi:glucosamine--fructose-6-phosphate aminotransferase (isomerizing)